MKKPSISVIIASLHEDNELQQTIDSCLSQVRVRVRVIVSLKVKSEKPLIEHNVVGDHAVVTIRRDDQGIADAWNNAIDFVDTDYVSFLGAGDYYISPKSLESLFEGAPNLSLSNVVIYGDQSILRPGGKLDPFPAPPIGHEKQALKGRMVIPHASSLWPATLFRCCRFDESFRIALDYEYALRTLNLVQYHYVATPVAVITTDGVSNRPSSLLRVVAEDARAKKQNGCSPLTSFIYNLKRILRWMINLAK
jgi:glycosyltransferase involved in cell wall biosynthesis